MQRCQALGSGLSRTTVRTFRAASHAADPTFAPSASRLVSSEFGFSLDQVNWLGNVLNLVFLPSSIIVPFVCKRLGITITVCPPALPSDRTSDHLSVLYWDVHSPRLCLGTLCRRRILIEREWRVCAHAGRTAARRCSAAFLPDPRPSIFRDMVRPQVQDDDHHGGLNL